MSFYRNAEVRSILLSSLLLTTAFALLGFYLSTIAGLAILVFGLLLTSMFFIFTWRRYQRLALLSMELDQILHGGEELDLASYAEGELAILQSQLAKMTVRLREQASALEKDKIHLTDAIADISHQLRTPLTSLNLIASLLRQSDLTSDRRQELVQELQQLFARIDWLVATLLKMTRIDAGAVNFQTELVAVQDLVQQAAAPFAIAMELRDQQFAVQVAEGTTFIGDLAWSSEALGNILKNCIEHTPPRGTVSVTSTANALYTEIEIYDNGCGIEPQDIPHLFERFYKGKNAGPQSVGIGLAMARSIISAQNGTIQVNNRPEGGTRFTIRFYRASEAG